MAVLDPPARTTDAPPRAAAAAGRRAPKVLFVGRSIGHFSYYDSVLAGLLQRGADVELVLDYNWSAKWMNGIDTRAMDEFRADHPDLKFDWLVRRSDKWRDPLFAMRELRSYRSYLVRPETTPFYVKRWRGYLTPEWKTRVEDPRVDAMVRSGAAEATMQALEAIAPPDPKVLEFVRSRSPDLMIVSPMNLRFSEEVEYAKAARKLGVPVAVITISWDNLSTKGLFHIRPDRLFVWNKYQLQDALEIQNIPESRISISGSPFFDKWFAEPRHARTRAQFCRDVGFDPKRPILLYLGSSKNIAKDESWFVQTVHDRLKGSTDPWLASVQILVRPHPANAEVFKKLNTVDAKVWPTNGALPETAEGFADMRDSFRNAVATLGINTSGMIDSVLADLPTFSVKLARYAQTQMDSKHFKHLVQADALNLCDSLTQFWTELRGLKSGKDPKKEQRRAFARDFARPKGLDRPAGDVIAEEALQMARVRR